MNRIKKSCNFISKNVLKEYLESREKKVMDIMMVLYDQEEAIQMYGESERYDEKIETVARMIADGDLPVDKIAKYFGLALEKVIELQKQMQPVWRV